MHYFRYVASQTKRMGEQLKDGDYEVMKWGNIRLLENSIPYTVDNYLVAFYFTLDCARLNRAWLNKSVPYFVVEIDKN